jgi:deazaflavin-dependent oxidoreductase (nitroreductase family)
VLTRAAKLAFTLLVVALTLAAGWLFGMRNKGSFVVRAQRRVNKAVFNPTQMQTAGRPGAYAAVVRHTGRTSGRTYETPVGAEPTDDGFVIALVYGRESDWLKNVLAAESATIVHEGREFEVECPVVVPIGTAIGDFPADSRGSLRLVGVTDCLRLRHVAPTRGDG